MKAANRRENDSMRAPETEKEVREDVRADRRPGEERKKVARGRSVEAGCTSGGIAVNSV